MVPVERISREVLGRETYQTQNFEFVNVHNTLERCLGDIGIETSFIYERITKVAIKVIARRQGPTQCPSQCSGLYQIKTLPFAASAGLHDHLATNLSCVRLIRFRLFVAQQRNGFANLPRNVAASTTLKPRAEICISPSSLRIQLYHLNTLLITAFGGSSLVRSSKLAFPTNYFSHAILFSHTNLTIAITTSTNNTPSQ